MEYISHSEAETEAFGERLAAALSPGAVVAYRGGLGMGKTAFTRGLARGLGCRGRVTSPTFTIVNEYEGPTPLFHFDMYRLNGLRTCSTSAGGLSLPGQGVCARRVGRAGCGRPCGGTVYVTPHPPPEHDGWRSITVEGGAAQ